ncbi:hypothetical protein BKA93DRAFT_826282 [Sparassis latifolia]
MGSWGGSGGISVIDVTDPENPAYCFVTSHTPLSAEQYMRCYYAVLTEESDIERKRRTEKDILKTIDLLDGENVVTLDMLAEAWPVREIITAAAGLKRLVLMGCMSVTPEELYDLLRKQPQLFYSLEALMHPALLRTSVTPSIRGCSLALFTPAGVVGALTDTLCSFRRARIVSFQMHGGMPFQAAATARPRAPDVPWGARSVVAVPTLSVDVLQAAEPGLAFLFQMSMFSGKNSRCFLRLVPTLLNADEAAPCAPGGWEVHDVRSFVRITTAEGRPALSEDAVQELEQLLRHAPLYGPQLRLMDRTASNEFMESVRMYEMHEDD